MPARDIIGPITDHAAAHDPGQAVINDRQAPGAPAEDEADETQDK